MKTKKEKVKLQCSEALVSALKHFEGLRLEAYKCPGGVWTIGYGHTKDVKAGDKITKYQAEQFLKEDLQKFEAIANKVKRISTQGRFDAVLDFIYNCGTTNFEKSTLKAYIECGKATWEIQEQFLRWVNAGGKKLGGLVSRRIWEAARFND
jgi:lysozyme